MTLDHLDLSVVLTDMKNDEHRSYRYTSYSLAITALCKLRAVEAPQPDEELPPPYRQIEECKGIEAAEWLGEEVLRLLKVIDEQRRTIRKLTEELFKQ
jgi:hypothetical protein